MTLTPAEDAEKDMRNKMINKEKECATCQIHDCSCRLCGSCGSTINIFARQNDQTTFELGKKSRRARITMITYGTGKT
jgi:hypothetical protein